MNTMLTLVTQLLIGMLSLTGLGLMGFGTYIALFTSPKKDAPWTTYLLVYLGYSTMVLSLIMIGTLLGHFFMWTMGG